jgi:N-acyl-D-amino-acid deacylase
MNKLMAGKLTRRTFLNCLGKAAILSAILPAFGCSQPAKKKNVETTHAAAPQNWKPSQRTPKVVVRDITPDRLLLKNGLVVDGTGQKAFYGDVLVNADRIEQVTPREVSYSGRSVDCTGKVIAPGFIDMHSHMDWVLPINGHPELKTPFTAQGVTTFVTGNCGFGVAAFQPDSPFRDLLEAPTVGLYNLQWETMAQYFDYLGRHGITHNLVNLAGHGTTRTSIRGFDPTPLNQDEMTALLTLLEEAMDQGAHGVSLGLQYEPGIFATMDELKKIATLVKRKDKILTVHLKAYSSLSGTYPIKFFGRPHNLLAIEDMLNLARETGVRLQISHLIFVGTRTWENYGEALALIDQAIAQGIDVKFDTYAYHCGTSIINVFMPEWFLANVTQAYDDRWSRFKLYVELQLIKDLLGFGFQDIQITNANHPELNEYNGMFLTDIARKRRMGEFDNFIDFARKSEGRARVLNHRYSNLEIVTELMKHSAALYQTDATPFPEGVQNPGAYGNFPLFLQYAREHRLLRLEEAIYKMTGASADRFQIRDRGRLAPGSFADITVFDWQNIKDNNNAETTDNPPTGIDAVFINGKQVLAGKIVDENASPGRVI